MSDSDSSKNSFDDDDDDDDDDDEDEEPEGDLIESQLLRGENKKEKSEQSRYEFLYAVSVSGKDKVIKNCLPKAVAILSNSKVVFLGHIRTMLECLDPGLAEICYIDTDSAIFSTTHSRLEECLRPDKKSVWERADLIADETGDLSCHGKMKCEGVYRAAKFKSLKVYRLYESVDPQLGEEEGGRGGGGGEASAAAYTRCKGVSRWLATQLPEEAFEPGDLQRFVIHRTCLRPARTGEMLLAHESRSMTAPFNLKRLVTPCGYHTFPVSDASGTVE
jgi:hypothetical protein